MILTILFYILLFLAGTLSGGGRKKKITWVCVITAIYTGIRWNYTPDYPAYEYLFGQFNIPDYEYDGNLVHVEYGWYLLNRLCGFMGYRGFVFFSSCLFSFGLYKLMEIYASQKYVWLIILGIVTAGGFTTLLSAQRQMFAASIFMISYAYLLNDKINRWRDLLSLRCIIYFALILLASTLHKSAFFLEIIPFMFLMPRRSYMVVVGLIGVLVFIYFLGSTVLVGLFEDYTSELGTYDYLKFNGDWSGSLTFLQGLMWAFMFYFTMKVYLNYNISRSEQAALLIAMVAILITFSGYYLGQVVRLAHYLFMFTYLNVGIIYKYLKSQPRQLQVYTVGMTIWVLWNAMKIFSINVGTFQEYKTIFSAL